MSDLVTRFRDLAADLRIVATLESTTWEVRWVRDDLMDVYDESDLESA